MSFAFFFLFISFLVIGFNIWSDASPQLSTKYYNPNYGYKEYWPGGEWIYDRDFKLSTTTTKNSADKSPFTTIKAPDVCGERIREVCARWTLEDSMDYFYDIPPDNLTRGYETYPSYCHYLAAQCKGKLIEALAHRSLVFVHVGKCVAQGKYFKDFNTQNETVDRMVGHIANLKARFKAKHITPC